MHKFADRSETSELELVTNHEEMRQYLCHRMLDNDELRNLMSEDVEGTFEEFYKKMLKPGVYGEHIMLKTAATVFRRNINIHPIFPNPHSVIQITPLDPTDAIYKEWHLLHFHEKHH